MDGWMDGWNLEMLGKWKSDPESTSGIGKHQNLISFRMAPLAHAYQVWSTSTNAFMSYLEDKHAHADIRVITEALR